ncbi:MAG: AraC family transcriptional regulator [Actinomycetota bacterium]
MAATTMREVIELSRRLDRTRSALSDSGRFVASDIDGFGLVESTTPSPLVATLYRPVVCLILQGAKVVELGSDAVLCEEGRSIIVSHELPIRSRITEASAERPYLALILDLDVALLRRLVDDVDGVDGVDADSRDRRAVALDVGTADEAVIDAFGRLLALCDSPTEAPVLAPLVVHEIHFRLLLAEHGAVLRRLLHRESHASRISKAIGHIRAHLAEPLTVPDLARSAGMSASSFHEHFRAVTATTPLQYQKELRLLEARDQLGVGNRTVTEVAFAVGYQSPTQFSREYSRKFGTPPSADRARGPMAATG